MSCPGKPRYLTSIFPLETPEPLPCLYHPAIYTILLIDCPVENGLFSVSLSTALPVLTLGPHAVTFLQGCIRNGIHCSGHLRRTRRSTWLSRLLRWHSTISAGA